MDIEDFYNITYTLDHMEGIENFCDLMSEFFFLI